MSRIGKKPIYLEKGIAVQLNTNPRMVVVKNDKGKILQVPFPENLQLKQKESSVSIIRTKQDVKTRSVHGLSRALIQNAVTGLSKGWSKTLELNGVGYKASVKGAKLELHLGYSHPTIYDIPEGITITVEKQIKIVVQGVDRHLVGLTANQIRSYRPVEPYLAKGIKYSTEQVRRKVGKSGGGEKKK